VQTTDAGGTITTEKAPPPSAARVAGAEAAGAEAAGVEAAGVELMIAELSLSTKFSSTGRCMTS